MGSSAMKKKIIQWLGREFVELSCEGEIGATVAEEAADLFRRFDKELREVGLFLDHTVRTRIWGRDRESRDQASAVRFKVLSGQSRSASSSYIAPDHFESDARIALDLLAMRPSHPSLEKVVKEYDPPRTPIRYLTFDSLIFLSGVTAVRPTLSDQMADNLSRLSDYLTEARTSWEEVVQISFYLHRSQKLEDLGRLFRERVKVELPWVEYAFVDGYSAEGKLVEIEVTAAMGTKIRQIGIGHSA
jgi:enamine deaminase RidA (YjgF/YER057c/UK114 family)